MNFDSKYITHYLYNFLIDKGTNNIIAISINLIIVIGLLSLLTIVISRISKHIIVLGFYIFSKRTKTSFDNYLFKSKFPNYIAQFIPFYLFKHTISIVLADFYSAEVIIEKGSDIYITLLIIWISRSVIRSIKNFLKSIDKHNDKPLDSFAQVFITAIWLIGFIVLFSIVTERSVLGLLTGLGAISAIILLTFKDSILGFVASIQISAYDAVRLGDWITIEKFGADGVVQEINITTVKIKNFDNTITTVPTYSLISDSFKNWRGMEEGGGRRIRRAIYIKQSTIRLLDKNELNEFSKIKILSDYIVHRQKDIDQYNENNQFDNSLVKVNGRNQTNLGLFRKYCDLYIENHTAVNKQMTLMTRHLPPTPYGIPLEIYCFCSDKRWENYERIMADIFEHLIASLSEFKLEVFEINNTDINQKNSIK